LLTIFVKLSVIFADNSYECVFEAIAPVFSTPKVFDNKSTDSKNGGSED